MNELKVTDIGRPALPVTADPDAAMVASMMENLGKTMAQAMTEPERIKAVEETKRVEIHAKLARQSLWAACGLILVVLVVVLLVEKSLLSQAITLIFGFLGGLGFGKIAESKK